MAGSTIGVMILTPVFLHRLHPGEYGLNEVLNVLASMLYILMHLGVGAVFIKIYVSDCQNQEERNLMVSSMVMFAASVAVVLALLSFLLAKPASSLLFGSPRHGRIVQIAVVGSGIQLVLSMIMQCLRAKQWALKFVIVSLIQFLVVIVFNIYFLLVLGLGVLGIQSAAALCYLIAVCVGLIVLRSDLVPRFSGKMVKYVLIVSLPVFPSSVAPWVLNVADRYVLNHFCGLGDTGLYAAGYKIGMVGMLALITAIQYAWPPLFYANSDSPDAPRFCATFLKHYLLVLLAAALGFSIFAPEIIKLIAKREYWTASWIVPYVAAAYVCYGVQFYSIPMFIRANQGKLLSIIMCGAAVANLLLNLVLVPRYGLSGAVAATVVTFWLITVLSVGYANRFFPVPYQYANIAKVIIISAAVYAAFHRVTATSVPLLALKSASFAALALLLFATKFFSPKELAVMQTVTCKFVRRLCPQLGNVA